jgi:hypothetical protein
VTIYLTDDGTLDTVLACSDCREEFRSNYASGDWDDDYTYDQFVDDFIEEINADHECLGRHE